MGREAMIKADMESVGTYNPIFDKTIRALAKKERELSRAEKAWRAAYVDANGRQREPQMVTTQMNKAGTSYTAKDPHYCVVDSLRKDVQRLRSQLGLTPKSLRRLREKQTAPIRPLRETVAEELPVDLTEELPGGVTPSKPRHTPDGAPITQGGDTMTNPRYSNGNLRRKHRARFRSMDAPCGICGGKLGPIHYDEPSDAKHPLSFVIDEIRPVSRWRQFGYDSPEACAADWNNLQAAHYVCNAKKGNGLRPSAGVRALPSVPDGAW